MSKRTKRNPTWRCPGHWTAAPAPRPIHQGRSPLGLPHLAALDQAQRLRPGDLPLPALDDPPARLGGPARADRQGPGGLPPLQRAALLQPRSPLSRHSCRQHGRNGSHAPRPAADSAGRVARRYSGRRHGADPAFHRRSRIYRPRHCAAVRSRGPYRVPSFESAPRASSGRGQIANRKNLLLRGGRRRLSMTAAGSRARCRRTKRR
jgi:hypothetical protein